MTITPKQKQQLLERLTKARIRGLNMAVLRAIYWHIHPDHGVAFAAYIHYTSRSGMSERTVQRTVQVGCDYLILGLAYREGPPVIWARELMDMEPAEAVRRANMLAANYRYRGGIGAKLATPTSSVTPPPPPAEVPVTRAAASTAAPAPSVASTTDLFNPEIFNPEILDAIAETAPDMQQFCATYRAMYEAATSKLAPNTASKLAPKLAPDLSPLNPTEQNPRKNESERERVIPSPPPPSCAVAHDAQAHTAEAQQRRATDQEKKPGWAKHAWRSTTRLPPASSAAHDLAVKIGKLCGLGTPTHNWPEHWRRKAPGIVQRWLTDYGWQPNEILSVIAADMKRKTDGPPDSIGYFEKPIGRLYASLERQRSDLEAKRPNQ